MAQAKECHTKSYPAKHYQSTKAQLSNYHRIIEDNPLATLVISTNNDVEISHIPCHFANANNTRLMAHVSNNHPLVSKLQKSAKVTKITISLIFHGGDAYVSPHDVCADDRKSQMVPTWNYAKVHVTGSATIVKNSDEKLSLMAQTSDYFECSQRSPIAGQEDSTYWKLNDAPDTAIKHMLNAITVFSVQISDIEGRLKMSQNKSIQVKEQIAKQLAIRGTAALGQLMLKL